MMVPSVFLSSAVSTTRLKQTILAPASDSWKTEIKSYGQHCYKSPNQPPTYDTCKRHGMVLLSEHVREKLFPHRSSEVDKVILSGFVISFSAPPILSGLKLSEEAIREAIAQAGMRGLRVQTSHI